MPCFHREESRGERRRYSTNSQNLIGRRYGIWYLTPKIPEKRARARMAKDRGFSHC